MNEKPNLPVPRPKIAVIDDDADMRMLLRHSLELRGYEVMEFESSEQALGWEGDDRDRSSTKPPLADASLVILDINLPGLSGIETIQLMKESPRLRNIPITMLTAHGEAEIVLKCIRAGASDYFVKPLNFPEIMRRIDKLLADPSQTIAKTAEIEISWNFQELLIREIKRSDRSSLPFGLLLGAVRKIPNHLGELSSDDIDRLWATFSSEGETLREAVEAVVEACRRRMREYDVIVPFGTAEFAAILPETRSEGQDAVIRKIHQVFSHEADLPPLSRQERWGLLIGKASYPEDGKDNLALFTTAESSLTDRLPEKPPFPGDDEFLFPRTVRCPACNRHFTYPKIAVRRLQPVDRESDLRLIFEDFDPVHYGVVACSTCGMACFEQDWRFLKDLQPPVFRWKYEKRSKTDPLRHPTLTLIPEELVEYLEPPYEAWLDENGDSERLSEIADRIRDRDKLLARAYPGDGRKIDPDMALARYLLARETARLTGASPLRRARLAHRIAWFFRTGRNTKDEKRFLAEALDFYRTAFHFEDLTDAKPSELEILYLLGELSFRLGREADAVAVFDHLVRDPRLESKEGFRKMVRRRWYEARHETPPE